MPGGANIRTKHSRRRFVRRLALAVVAGSIVGGGLAVHQAVQAIAPVAFQPAELQSVTVVDRDGDLLRAFTTSDGRWRLPIGADEVDPRYLELLFAFEDRRFHAHGGVDLQALARAGLQFVQHGRIVSGASTLTMQVSRLLDGQHERSAQGKFRQIVRALEIESRRNKKQILELYLRLAPFGGNIEGVRAASLAYFGKEPRRLSLGQAALLVALPQSPETRRPDRFPERARHARERVLNRAVAAGVINSAEAKRASQEAIPQARRDFPNIAAHLAEAERAWAPHTTVHRLTIRKGLQRSLETLARQHVVAHGSQLSTAILVVDHTSGEVLAHVGSAGYFDAERFGAIDMTGAIRSPGSTLKPLIYGLGFEDGLIHPETLIDDRPTRFGTYAPKNFENDFHGTITIREALARSLNVPAVKVLDGLGPGRLVGRLERAGFKPALPEGAEPSLAIALGGVGLTLRDLTGIFAAIARGGEPVDLRHRHAKKPSANRVPDQLRRLLSPVASYYATDILKDAAPPPNARPGQIAYKTGTSYGHRDAWAVGYDGQYTIGVWVGRPDAASTPGLMGRTAAAPILFDAFQRISPTRVRFAQRPADALVRSGGELPEPLKRFEKSRTASVAVLYLDPPVRISFPPDRSEVAAGSMDSVVVLKASGGLLPLTWLANGRPIGEAGRDRQLVWDGGGEGFVQLSVVDAKGRVDRVTVRLRRDG
jgi:penicillin-binding protein 1C